MYGVVFTAHCSVTRELVNDDLCGRRASEG